jgi:prephenate dehydrogenase
MGGSMAIDLRESGIAHKTIGVDKNTQSLDQALQSGIIDEKMRVEDGVKNADLIILSTPVDVMLKVLPSILDMVDDQIVIDIGSTKKSLLDSVKYHPKRANYVATHPMAGTERSGIGAAAPNLFKGKYTAFCDIQDSAPVAVQLVEKMHRSLGMKVLYMDGEDHDVHTAYISHISHISSFALALTVLEKEKKEQQIFDLASSGFATTVRLAKSSPDMWTPIFQQNRDNILNVLNEHIDVLTDFRTHLIKNDFGAFHEMMKAANQIKRVVG